MNRRKRRGAIHDKLREYYLPDAPDTAKIVDRLILQCLHIRRDLDPASKPRNAFTGNSSWSYFSLRENVMADLQIVPFVRQGL